MTKKYIILLFTLCFISLFKTQTPPPASGDLSTLPSIIPPSPTAYALGNYGNVPVGLFTGASNFSLPLFTYKTNNITLPLNIFYGSNGIKVDEISSNVGLGWNLNFGGVISRMVRDKPDEQHTFDFVPDNVDGGMTNTVALQFFQNAGNSTTYDTQSDIYYFNFNGISGKFFYDRNHQPHLIDQQGIKIETIPSSVGNGKDFVLTLSTGEKYFFTEKEQTIYRSVGAGHSIPQSSITAWYLSKIIHPKGDEIYFTYEENQIPYYTGSESQTLTMTYPYMQFLNGYPITQSPSLSVIQQNNIQIIGVRIKTISSNNPSYGNINFNYLNDYTTLDIEGNFKIQNIVWKDQNDNIIETVAFNYLNTTNKRNFLSSLIFKDPSKSYTFEYENPSGFPTRLSYSQDYWGYYNGKANSNLVPKNIPNGEDYGLSNYNYSGADKTPDPNFAKIGLLKKVIYPTKGYTELDYEGNTYWGEKTDYPPVTYKEFNPLNPTVGIVTQDFTFVSPIDQKITLSGACFYYNPQNPDPAGGPTHTPSGAIQLTTNDNGVKFYTWSQSSGQQWIPLNISGLITAEFYSTTSQTIYFDAKAGKSYTLSFSVKRSTSGFYDLSYYNSAPNTINTNLNTGGVRIKSTKDYDSSSSIPKYKRYYYGPKDDVNHSSGEKGFNPVYVDNILQHVTHGTNEGTANFLAVTSSSVMNMYDSNSNCFYKYVTTSDGGDNFEKGGESKEFIIHRDYPGNNVWGVNFQSAPWANFGWDNGLELKSQILAKDSNSQALTVINEKENNYEQNESNKFELNNYAFRLRYDFPFQQSVTKVCTAEDVERVYHHYVCTTNHHHETWIGINKYTCIAPGANNVDQPEYDLCHNHSVGETVVYSSAINNLDVMEYKTISYWQYLKSQKITDYLNGVPLLTQTEYFYNNPSNYQLSKQKVTSPDATVNEINYAYAHEKGNQLMIDKNMIGIPLETTSTQTIGASIKTLAKTETVYPTSIPTTQAGNSILPLSVKSFDIPNNTFSTEAIFDKYDEKGNLQQYTTKDGTPVSIVWGYNNTLPIAKVEGITYAQLVSSGLISPIVSASDSDASNPNNEGALITALDTFRRSAALQNTKITTLTYDPSVGVTSITSSQGIREIYKYDSANRLEKVSDQEGKPLKDFKYNYKN